MSKKFLHKVLPTRKKYAQLKCEKKIHAPENPQPPTSPLEENNGPSAYDVDNNNTSRCAICFSLGGIEKQLNFDRYDFKVNSLVNSLFS